MLHAAQIEIPISPSNHRPVVLSTSFHNPWFSSNYFICANGRCPGIAATSSPSRRCSKGAYLVDPLAELAVRKKCGLYFYSAYNYKNKAPYNFPFDFAYNKNIIELPHQANNIRKHKK